MSGQPSDVYRSQMGAQAIAKRYRELLAKWPVPHEQRYLATGQGETFVIVCGPPDAPPLLLLHGSGFNSVSWMGDVAMWAESYRVHAVDVIGHPGLSAPSRPPYQTAAHAEWLLDVMRGLGVERAAIAGISLGGWLGIDFASRHPERVSALVLLAPGGVGRDSMSMPKLLLTVLPLMLFGDWGRKRAMARMLGPWPVGDQHEQHKQREVSDFHALINRHFRNRLDRLPRFDDAMLSRLAMPVMLVVGGLDPMIDSAETCRRLIACVRQIEVLELPEVGHVVVGQTRPIFEFLQRVTSRSPTAA